VVWYFHGMRTLQVLLVNPPIFDFTAYDFWLRPYGMMRVAGRMQDSCQLEFFDFLNTIRKDTWGRGRFESCEISRPAPLKDIPRKFRRFGRRRTEFRNFLSTRSLDAVLIQTVMTYWYAGVKEVIDDVRELQPRAKIILGGVYATLCPEHARSLGPDLVIEGADLEPLWSILSIKPEEGTLYWPSTNGDVGVIKISEGCPFRCTYCSAPLFWPGFAGRPTGDCIRELNLLLGMGVGNIAFYDDALLFRADAVLAPFLEAVIKSQCRVRFHTPNALNARFMTPDLARLMVQAGFASFFLGFESGCSEWQRSTGGKVSSEEIEAAVHFLREAGAESIVTYLIVGHPDSAGQDTEASIRFAHRCDTRVLLSEFSPVPGTPDFVKSLEWAERDEPLSHNKTAFAIRRLGADDLNRLKSLTHSLNSTLQS
jgi:pyruvate-formate lyase-activating enzyme